jgi:hypothetical protein
MTNKIVSTHVSWGVPRVVDRTLYMVGPAAHVGADWEFEEQPPRFDALVEEDTEGDASHPGLARFLIVADQP